MFRLILTFLIVLLFTLPVRAGDLDGKALLCTSKSDSAYPVYGLVFDKGKVTKWLVMGYSKVTDYTFSYNLIGTDYVHWRSARTYLNRQSLTFNEDQCSVSSKAGIFQKLDQIIAAAKKKNKI